MRRLAAAAAALLLTAGVTTVLVAPQAAQAADTGPTLVLSKSTAMLGEYIGVTGSGFPIGARLQVETCGTGGSSNSCAIADAAFATVDALGGFHLSLHVTEPPTPCPCTVHAAPFAGTAADPVDVPISVPGLRYLPQAAPVVTGSAKLMDATVVGDSPFLSQLGADGSAQVTVTFANLSGGPAPDPGVTLTLSRGGVQIGRYPVLWTGGALPVGRRRALVYELPLPGGWFRDYEIGVVVGTAAGKPVTVRTLSAAVRPWGELVAPAALAFGVSCLLLARRRRHEPVRGLPVRTSAPAGRRSGVAAPEPFSGVSMAVEPATLGIVVAPELEIATPEAPEKVENGPVENGPS
jgi:hypothetical protein